MMDDLSLDYPYELAKSGKWTIDRLKEYTAAGARLNGDESFAFSEAGKSVVGMSTPSAGIWGRFLFGAGERTVESDGSKLVFTAGSERYFDAVSRLASSFSSEDGTVYYLLGSSDDAPGSYIWMFENERAMFMTAEICKSGRLRDIDFSFGVLPFPKLDETQESYYHGPFMNVPGFAIPVTSKTPERTAALGDALTYLSWDMVLPVYREITLEQKNLRSDDAIEMLDLIINSTTPILTNIYTVGKELISEIGKAISENNDQVSSMVAARKEAVLAELEKING
jgi:hypothetical protein